jgi:hypothetical protein
MKTLILISLFFVGCVTPFQGFNPHIYVGDSTTSSLVDKDGNYIKADSVEFDNMVAITADEAADLQKRIQKANRMLQQCGYR